MSRRRRPPRHRELGAAAGDARDQHAAQQHDAARPDAARDDERFGQAVEELEQLYARLPALACRGLCGASCGEHVDASGVERRRLLGAGVDLEAVTGDGACPALSRTLGTGVCTVHAVRPMICRLWGTAESMPCPHGCIPLGGRVDDASAMRAMMSSLRVGGHGDAGPGVGELVELALHDPAAARLLSRFLRGDRTVTAALSARMASLRT